MMPGEVVVQDIVDPRVRRAFDAFDEQPREHLLAVRELVFETAAAIEGVGPIEESLRWGEPAYLTPSGTGTTLRLASKGPEHAALYVHCQTDLIATFREAHGEVLTYEGTRAVRLDLTKALPREALEDCIALVLTYKLRKRRAR